MRSSFSHRAVGLLPNSSFYGVHHRFSFSTSADLPSRGVPRYWWRNSSGYAKGSQEPPPLRFYSIGASPFLPQCPPFKVPYAFYEMAQDSCRHRINQFFDRRSRPSAPSMMITVLRWGLLGTTVAFFLSATLTESLITFTKLLKPAFGLGGFLVVSSGATLWGLQLARYGSRQIYGASWFRNLAGYILVGGAAAAYGIAEREQGTWWGLRSMAALCIAASGAEHFVAKQRLGPVWLGKAWLPVHTAVAGLLFCMAWRGEKLESVAKDVVQGKQSLALSWIWGQMGWSQIGAAQEDEEAAKDEIRKFLTQSNISEIFDPPPPNPSASTQ